MSGNSVSRILIIDDSHEFTELVAGALRHRGHDAQSAHSGRAGLGLAGAQRPDLVILDLHLAEESGIEVLHRLRDLFPDLPVVIVTGQPDVPSAVAALKGSAVDYLCKPFPFEELDAVLTRVLKVSASPATPAALTEARATAIDMIGASPATAELRTVIHQLAAAGVRPALITGESGTGKDLAARMFHAASARRSGPFVEVNCSAVGEALFESEFFGHERGAFTGAIGSRRGFAEVADGGTLFLDEIGEIPLTCQPKLLRFLEDQSFFRVGGSRKVTVDVQVIAATNRDLRAMVEQWAFRPDLYFRLNVVPVVVSPLRDRPEDILPLVAFWLAEVNARYGKAVRGFTREAEARLLTYPWPGNVRELRNLVERLVILCGTERIGAEQLPLEITSGRAPEAGSSANARATDLTLAQIERAHIRKVLADAKGNKTRAASILGISRETLRAKVGPDS